MDSSQAAERGSSSALGAAVAMPGTVAAGSSMTSGSATPRPSAPPPSIFQLMHEQAHQPGSEQPLEVLRFVALLA